MADLLERVREWLAEIPELYAMLPMYRAPGSLPPDPEARRATTNPSRPNAVLEVVALADERDKPHSDGEVGVRDTDLDSRAGERRQGILPTLGMWVSMVSAELIDLGEDVDECCPAHEHTIAGEAAWLVKYAERALELHDDFAEDIAWMHRDLRKAVGERDPLDFYCPKCGWLIEPVDGAAWFRCTGCPQTWRLDAEIRRLGATQPDMSLRECARRLNRPLATLREWASRGKILPVGRRGQVFLYDLERVREYADTRLSRAVG